MIDKLIIKNIFLSMGAYRSNGAKHINLAFYMRTAILSLSFLGFSANAACSFYDGGRKNIVIPLSGTISITDDMPDNTDLGHFIRSHNHQIKCTTTNQFYGLIQHSGIPLSNVGGIKLYKTGLDGILFSFGRGGSSVAANANETIPYTCNLSDKSKCAAPVSMLTLKKFGNIQPGILQGSSLPVISSYLGQSGAMVHLGNVSFSGSITFTTPTCKTSDVKVEMDKHKINTFTGKGSITPWKDASITLSDCTQFLGYRIYVSYDDSGNLYNGNPTSTMVSNAWELSLAPIHGVIDSANGIMEVSAESGAAKGIGIQLGYGSTVSAANDLVNFSSPKSGALPKNGSRTIKIPLAARYIQTQDSITPGSANGRLTFTISYK